MLENCPTTVRLHSCSVETRNFSSSVLKWQCHEIFFGIFFYETNPPEPLKNWPKWFYLKIRFRGDIREIRGSTQANIARSQKIKLAVIKNWQHFVESDSAQANSVWSQILRRLTLRGVLPASLDRPLLALKENITFFVSAQANTVLRGVDFFKT